MAVSGSSDNSSSSGSKDSQRDPQWTVASVTTLLTCSPVRQPVRQPTQPIWDPVQGRKGCRGQSRAHPWSSQSNKWEFLGVDFCWSAIFWGRSEHMFANTTIASIIMLCIYWTFLFSWTGVLLRGSEAEAVFLLDEVEPCWTTWLGWRFFLCVPVREPQIYKPRDEKIARDVFLVWCSGEVTSCFVTSCLCSLQRFGASFPI